VVPGKAGGILALDLLKKHGYGNIGFLSYRLRHSGLKDAAPIYVQT
jgi:hypothetical protein